MMADRILQHATLALDGRESNSSYMFAYVAAGLAGLACVILAGKATLWWICKKYYGRDIFAEPLTGDEILAGLTEEQRKAVIHTILSQVCKTATDSDVSQLKQTGKKEEDDAPIADIEIPIGVSDRQTENDDLAAQKETEGNSSDTLPKDVEDPINNQSQSSVGESEENLRGERDAEESTNRPHVDHGVEEDCASASKAEAEMASETGSLDIEQGPNMPTEQEEEDDEVLDSNSSIIADNIPPSKPAKQSAAAHSQHDDESSNEHVCPICLSGYEKGNLLFVSKHCSHIFHVSCIAEWLAKNHDCPICRVEIVTKEEMVSAAMALIDKNDIRIDR